MIYQGKPIHAITATMNSLGEEESMLNVINVWNGKTAIGVVLCAII